MTSERISPVWGTILLTITIFSLSLPAYAKYSGGTGELNDPYQIAMAEDPLDYVVNVSSKQLHFVAQPEAGYVLKTRNDIGSIDTVSRFLKSTGDIKISQIHGLGQHGVYKVEGQSPTINNRRNMITLQNYSDIEYVLPLFEIEGEIIAIMPEIIARLRHEDDLPQLVDFCGLNECCIIRNVIYTNFEYLLETAQKTPEKIFNTVDKLNKMDFIDWAVPDVALEIDLCGPAETEDLERKEPNDEYFPQQWHLEMIRAPEAWTITQGDPNIVVAVIDEGFDIEHPDLVENIWRNPIEQPGDSNGDGAPGLAGIDDDADGLIDEDSNNLQPGEPNYINDLVNDDDENGFEDDIHGWNFLKDDNTLSSRAHGTMCAGLIAAIGRNGLGVTGVTWNCKIMPLQAVLTEDECVRGMAYAEALRYAAANGADVISNSWHIYQEMYTYDKNGRLISYHISPYDCLYIRSAVMDITERGGIGRSGKGCIVLAASGNWSDPNDRPVSYPAAYPEVISVGATDTNDKHWSYSGSGSSLDIVAPSGNAENGNLWTTDTSGSQGKNNRDPNILDYTDMMGGTSGACPIAAGVAALVLSVEPTLTSFDLHRILLRSARDLGPPGWDEEYGFGCVDAFAAVMMTLYPSEGSTLFVDDDALNDPAPGDPNLSDPYEDGSTEHPYDAIQEAINNSVSGDTIVILNGTYSGAGNYNINSKNKSIHICSESGPENCIVDCQGLARGFLFWRDIFGGSMLEGLTITNGNGHQRIGYNAQPIGGAIICWKNSHVTIVNCRLTANSAGIGGAIDSSGELTIIRSEISDNIADKSGGGLSTSNDLTIIDSVIIGNSAHRMHGGGIAHNGNLRISNSIISGNSARDGYGGGVFVGQQFTASNETIPFDHLLIGCTLSGNAAEQGGGLYNCSDTELVNCNFIKNSAISGSGIKVSNSNLTLTNCIVWNNTLRQDGGTISATYSDIQGGWEGQGNIDADPLFVDADNDDYHLKSQAGHWDPVSQDWIHDDISSPCINTGDPNISVGDEPEPNGDRINIGAYGGTSEASKSPSGLPKYSGGTGESDNPYMIAKSADLILLGASPEDYNKQLILTADIDLDPNLPSRKVFDTSVIAPDLNEIESYYQGTPFTGIFDGNGHTISHLTIEGGSYLGLFGQIEPMAEVKNLGVVNVNIMGSGSYVGGLIGRNNGGYVANCYSIGTITGNEMIGGLVGGSTSFLGRLGPGLNQCYSSSRVSGNIDVGGLMGINGCDFSNSYSTGTVTGNKYVGGLVGYNIGKITTSYNIGPVSGDQNVGGLVGMNLVSITTSYSTGTVKGIEYVGGLVGYNIGMETHGRPFLGKTTVSFWDVETSGQSRSAGGIGMTTAEMQTAVTFFEAGWDFVDETANGTEDIWWILEGQDYPRLWWESLE